MVRKRIYSTRELAQLWNLSESTIKRWTDAGKLQCDRTPGGHRRFQLKHIQDFQARHRFEGTGLLTSTEWEDPQLETFVNQRNWSRVRELILYLASENQCAPIKDLLERLYIRGLSMGGLYDEVLAPIFAGSRGNHSSNTMSLGQARLVEKNLEEALYYFFPGVVCRRPLGKTGLCAAPAAYCSHFINGISRVLNEEGWDALNLGSKVPFDAMAEMVEEQPVNLACVHARKRLSDKSKDRFRALNVACERYRIPVLLLGPGFSTPGSRMDLSYDEYIPSFRDFSDYIQRVVH
jgi:excisionase family DNA binding protein